MAVIKQLQQTYDIRLFATFYAYGRNLFYLLNNSRMMDFEEYFKICSLYFLINCYREDLPDPGIEHTSPAWQADFYH